MKITNEQAVALVNNWKGFWRYCPSHVVRRVLKLSSLTEVARLVKLPPSTFRYHLDEGLIPKPSVRWKRSLWFTEAEVEKIKAYFRGRA